MSVILTFLLGLILLVLGAEGLVRSASRIAAALGVAPLVIGLTVVAFGTSAPEMAVSVQSAMAGNVDISIGNVVGSNVFNVLCILGLSALIVPLAVSQKLVRIDVPLMILLSVLMFLLSLDGGLGMTDGVLLVAGLVLYITYLIIESRRNKTETNDEFDKEYGKPIQKTGSWILYIVLVVASLVMLVLGSNLFIKSAIVVAQMLGVSERIIGLTIVAAGTSLPELVTSVVAALHRERDIAVGNIVGSNIFNIMGVLGVVAILAPDGIAVSSSMLAFDFPIMIAVALLCLPVFFTGSQISRLEGVLLFGYYIVYTLYLVLAETKQSILKDFNKGFLYVALPVTVAILFISMVREIRERKRAAVE